MKRIQKAAAILCAIIMSLYLIIPAYADEETAASTATPTDLGPAAEEEILFEEEEQELPDPEPVEDVPADEYELIYDEEDEEETEEESSDGVEIIVTKALQPGQSWDGKIKRKTPSIIKLDFVYSQTVHILIEGIDVAASLQKADKLNEEAEEKLTDPETEQLMIDLNAEAGSYLLFLHAGENSLLALVSVTVMDQNAYETWTAEQLDHRTEEQEEETFSDSEEEPETNNAMTEQTETESEQTDVSGPEKETETEPEKEPATETEPESENGPESETGSEPETEPEPETQSEAEEETEQEEVTETIRTIDVNVTWDVPNPVIGDTAHFTATLNGYEGLDYTMQWQYSTDRISWTDITGETNDTMNVIVTEENNLVYWRIIVYLEEDEEQES